ncbi:AAA domain-containing protein [Protofrankia symbiont of Coriaria ruscifolia]|uniref:AAA domain-containing protein n=1 Tax=Protofrankia symbiont of Coriaria ruscifolia TaxID=1306542 RepID=UPI001F5E7C0A|nr:AAA domain-containing protein [Protofrankia symbiont of Coriaria ruscifolia]
MTGERAWGDTVVGHDEKVKARSLHLLDYLAALALELSAKPKRRLAEYDSPLIRPHDIPTHTAVVLGTSALRSAWLRVRKVAEPPPPALPARLANHLVDATVDLPDPPALPADFEETCARDGEDPQHLRAELSTWIAGQWEPWANTARPARSARLLYQRLYDLRLRLARDNATHELVWGHGILSWAPDGQPIDHPLLITRLTIEMDPDSGDLSVVPDGYPGIETDPLHGLGIAALDELTTLRDAVRASPPDPWSEDGLTEVYQQVVAPLGLDARVLSGPRSPFDDHVPPPAAAPVLVDTWVVFVRPRPALYQRFYAELRQVLTERDMLPEALAAVVGNDGDSRVSAGDPTATATPDDGAGLLGQRLLMPLPTNDEQERIAIQLERARGVTVQGPPGTGKSHTIANLVSHLVAHGRRVLVTAHNEQALAVLRDKIPPELRDLSIAVLGSTSAALGELRASAQMIMDAVSSIDERTERATVAALVKNLDAARAEQRRLELRLVDLLAGEAAEFPLADGPAKAARVADWLASHETDRDRIPDRLAEHQRPPLSVAELDELIRLAAITTADVTAARHDLPARQSLPSAGQLTEQYRLLDGLRDELADLEAQGASFTAMDTLGEDALAGLVREVHAAAARVCAAEEPWLATVRAQVAQSEAFAGFWAEQADQLAADTRLIVELRRATFGRTVVVAEGDPRVQEAMLDELADRFAAGKGVPRVGGRDLRAFHAGTRLDGLELRTAGDAETVRAKIRERTTVAAAGRRYHDLVGLVGGPPLSPDSPAFVPSLESNVARLRDAIAWEATDGPVLLGRLRAVLPGMPARPTGARLTAAGAILEAAAKRGRERQLTAWFDNWRTYLGSGGKQPNPGPLWGMLRDILDRRDFPAWTAACDEIGRLTDLRPALDRRDALAERLAAAAPQWTVKIIDSGGNAAVCGSASDLPELWRWRQAQTWLDALLGRGDVAVLQRQVAETTAGVRRLVLDVAVRSARLGMKTNLREDQRRALMGWLQALARIGKGTGKFARRWEADAREQMPDAMGTVPVWIMPIHRVLQSFDPRRTDLFDVVIVDESSQCDVLSLGVLALGRKVVVVGDDKQISPAAVGVDRSRVFQLIETHLPDLEQRSLLDVEASLYDTATRVFPDVVLLREHFRCVPDIIEFSNRFYAGRILPLREDTDLGIGPPVRPVRVHDGVRTRGQYGDVNEPEALAVVQQILDCHNNPAYDTMTFGVVTLLGSAQGRLIEQNLLAALGSDEYEERRIRVGDPYNFQGDERDVIFISVVADDNRSAATKKADQQRINVAASRARNQLWIFHSVDPGVLHVDDVRGQLLTYAYGVNDPRTQAATLEEQCESDFERRVLRDLLRRGYRVRPQYPVGHFRIDLVVEGEHDRLAVECDGEQFHGPQQWDADLRRQRVLERMKWKFWRVRGSAYYRYPEAALTSLWERLDELGIHPAEAAAVPSQPPPTIRVDPVDARDAEPSAPGIRGPSPATHHPEPDPAHPAVPEQQPASPVPFPLDT